MSDKKAFIFDTNFIIQNQKLDEVVKQLSDQFTVYVTQMSIDERIAQRYRDDINAIGEAEKLQKKHKKLFTVSINFTKDEIEEKWREDLQNSYSRIFGDRIIPFSKDEKIFDFIIDRANKKLPPFVEGESDKGFKDCVIWYSILEYFKEHGEKEVLFITNDKGFLNKADYFADEFQKVTGKTIIFQHNSYYKELLESYKPKDESTEKDEKIIPNIGLLREKVETVVENITIVRYCNEYGNLDWDRTFFTSKLFDKDYVQIVMEGLSDAIKKHYLETSIKATDLLEYDDRIENGTIEIPMISVEALQKLYEEIKKQHSQYLEQFFEATAKILNNNYVAPPQYHSIDDELPF